MMPDEDKASVKDQVVEKFKNLKPVSSSAPSPVMWSQPVSKLQSMFPRLLLSRGQQCPRDSSEFIVSGRISLERLASLRRRENVIVWSLCMHNRSWKGFIYRTGGEFTTVQCWLSCLYSVVWYILIFIWLLAPCRVSFSTLCQAGQCKKKKWEPSTAADSVFRWDNLPFLNLALNWQYYETAEYR